MSKRAWVTLATNDSYGLGALVLAHSLRRAGSTYPAVVLVTPAVTDAMRDRLNAVFEEVITVDVLDSRDAAHLALLRRPELGITFTKIHCWSLTQFDKCVFLDADALVVQNCDELFEREELSAAPDVGWPDCFNSGVFVFAPSADTYTRLIEFAQERGSFDGGDQGLLNSFFSDWAHGDINKHLPFLYNVTSAAFYSYLPALQHYGQDLKIIHFIGATKPWLQQYNWGSGSVEAPDHIKGLLQTWWDIFVGQVHTQLDVNMETTVVEEQPRSPSPVLPPEDNENYYEPSFDPQSEFPWHHPETHKEQTDIDHKVDTTQLYDPWQHYRADVPQHFEHYSDHTHVDDSTSHNDSHSSQHYQPHNNSGFYQQNTWSQNQYHQEHSHNWHQQSQEDHHHESQQHHQQSHHDHTHHIDHTHHHHQHYDHSHQNLQHAHSHDSYHDNTQHNHTHTHSHDNIQKELKNEENYDQHYLNTYNSSNPNATHHGSIHISKAQYVYYLIMDVRARNRRNRNQPPKGLPVIPETITNGNSLETEDDYDDHIPRHPYDGFYLRHRSTIDPRGRKICTHEIPPTPNHSPSRYVPDDMLAINDYDSSEEYESASECDQEDNTGVAGNLARVVPGSASYQYEAIDELNRRQGWEAGNIDYMGADSFDNIWAKISQSLNDTKITEPKQPSPPRKEPTPKRKEPTPPKESSPPKTDALVEATKPAEAAAPEPVVASLPVEAPAPVAAPVDAPATVEVPKPTEQLQTKAKPAEVAEAKVEKTEPTVPPTPPATPKSTPEASTPVSEVPPTLEASPLATAPVPASSETTPLKDASAVITASTDSPPLVQTPSKDEPSAVPDPKSEERRKPAEKLRLSAPTVADPLPTPDSELEDAASLATSIIAAELRTTLTAPTPQPEPKSPPLLIQQQRLSVDSPDIPTPPVSLAQIGIKTKPKPTIAAQIESSLTGKTESSTPSTPSTPISEPTTPTDAPKKKVVKKVVKKEAPSGDGSTPVPPPRKKEKKPKEK